MAERKKILTVVGTRPNFIKITQFDKEFSKFPELFEHRLLHTGQHYDDNMSKIFFEQFKLKEPDYYLNIQGISPGEQIGAIITAIHKIFEEYKPDLVMVVGDVNSTMAASIAADKANIRTAHVESGLRSFDREMPEEKNRIITDLLADILLLTEKKASKNLLKEGKEESQMHFVGNTMIDTLVAFDPVIQQNDILEKLGVAKGNYALMTMHRPRNVDFKDRLEILIQILNHITEKLPLVFPIHPRTKKRMEDFGLMDELTNKDRLIFTPALDYLAFQKLVSDAKFVITDSGGIQEETTYRQVPCITLRNNTERPSTVEIGSNVLAKYKVEDVSKWIRSIEDGSFKKGNIPEFWDGQFTSRIVEVLKNIL